MHFAICSTHIVDRNQLERLIKRESDKNSAQHGIITVDTFGCYDNLFSNPMQYDAFFFDLDSSEPIPEFNIQNLRLKGVKAPIILCFPNEHLIPESSSLLFLQKPIQSEKLTLIIQHIREQKNAAQPMIELRVDKETYYVTEAEIMYAVTNKNNIEVHLTNHRLLTIQNTISNLFSEISMFESFFAPNSKSVLNSRHIQNIKGRKAIMTDGTIFSIGFSQLSYAKYAFRIFHKDSDT